MTNINNSNDFILENYHKEFLLYESRHVNLHIEPVATDITTFLLNAIYKIVAGVISFRDNLEMFTNWSFTSNEDRNPKLYQKIDDVPNLFVKTYNEKKYHPIFIILQSKPINNNPNVVAGIGTRAFSNKNELSDKIKVLAKEDRINIYVNLKKLHEYDITTIDAKNLIISVIGHELFHASERFIIRYDDVLNHKKNMLYRDVFKNEFNLNITSDDYKFIETLLYYITPEEQRARINQLDILLKKFTQNPSSDFWNKIYLNIQVTSQMMTLTTNKEHIIVCSFLKNKKIETATMLYSFFKFNKVFQDENISNDYHLIIAYHLFDHNLLDIKNTYLKPSIIKKKLTVKNIQLFINGTGPLYYDQEFLRTIIKCSKKTVNNNFINYQTKIYDTIISNLKNMNLLNINVSPVITHPTELSAKEIETIFEHLRKKR